MALRINLPPLTRACLAALILLSVTFGALRYRLWSSGPAEGTSLTDLTHTLIPYLTLVPQLSIYYPWVFVTASFVETNIFTLLVTGATLFSGGKYLERAWSGAEFAKFLAVVTVIPNLAAFFIYIIWFAATSNVAVSLSTICGGVGLQAGFLVAFKQLVPEHTVTIAKGMIKIRVKVC
jgi:membrane associated rhomboid family serine protease